MKGGEWNMEIVFVFLTSIVNLVVSVINLTIATKNRQEKDLRSAKRKSYYCTWLGGENPSNLPIFYIPYIIFIPN